MATLQQRQASPSAAKDPSLTTLAALCAHILSNSLPKILEHRRDDCLHQREYLNVIAACPDSGTTRQSEAIRTFLDEGCAYDQTLLLGAAENVAATDAVTILTPPASQEEFPAWGSPLPAVLEHAERHALAHLRHLRSEQGQVVLHEIFSDTGTPGAYPDILRALLNTLQLQCCLMLEAVLSNDIPSLMTLHYTFPDLLDIIGEEALLVALMTPERSQGLLTGSCEEAAKWLLARGLDLPEEIARSKVYSGKLCELQQKKALQMGDVVRSEYLSSFDYLSSLYRNRFIILAETESSGPGIVIELQRIFNWLLAQLKRKAASDLEALQAVAGAMDGCAKALGSKGFSRALQMLHSEASVFQDLAAEDEKLNMIEASLLCASAPESPNRESLIRAVECLLVCANLCCLRGQRKGSASAFPAKGSSRPADIASALKDPKHDAASKQLSAATTTTIFIVTDRAVKRVGEQPVGFERRRRTGALHYAQVTFVGVFPGHLNDQEGGNVDDILRQWERNPLIVPEGAQLRIWEGDAAINEWMTQVRHGYTLGDISATDRESWPLLVVPGYNLDWLGGLRMGLELSSDLHRKGPVMVFSWCSNSMWGAAGYINVRWGMARNVPQMVEILNALQVNFPGDRTSEAHAARAALHLIAHSMGCQISTQALADEDCRLFEFTDLSPCRVDPSARDVPNRVEPSRTFESKRPWMCASEATVRLKPSFIFIQADVEVHTFKERAKNFALRGLPTLYCAEDDIALWGSMYLRWINCFSPRAGLYAQTSARATRYDTVDASGLSADAYGHSCWRNRAVASDIRGALGGAHPLDRRGHSPYELHELKGRVPLPWSFDRIFKPWTWRRMYIGDVHTIWYKLTTLH